MFKPKEKSLIKIKLQSILQDALPQIKIDKIHFSIRTQTNLWPYIKIFFKKNNYKFYEYIFLTDTPYELTEQELYEIFINYNQLKNPRDFLKTSRAIQEFTQLLNLFN